MTLVVTSKAEELPPVALIQFIILCLWPSGQQIQVKQEVNCGAEVKRMLFLYNVPWL